MASDRPTAAWARLAGTVGAAAAVGVLLRYDAAVALRVGAGVAVVGAALAAGMAGVRFLADADDPPYLSPPTVASAPLLLLVVGFSLAFLGRLRAT